MGITPIEVFRNNDHKTPTCLLACLCFIDSSILPADKQTDSLGRKLKAAAFGPIKASLMDVQPITTVHRQIGCQEGQVQQANFETRHQGAIEGKAKGKVLSGAQGK